MLKDSLKVELGLNILLRGLNALSGIYLASIVDEEIAVFFAYLGLVNILRGVDFGYNYYQRHFNMSGMYLARMSGLIFLVVPACLLVLITPSAFLSSAIQLVLTAIALKYIGTFSNIINKTWIIALPLSVTFISFIFFNVKMIKEIYLMSSLILWLFTYLKYSTYRSLNMLKKANIDIGLWRNSTLVFVPSALFLLLSEYVFVYYTEDLASLEWVAIFLKLNATIISVVFLMNDLYWNRYGYVEWPWLWSVKSQLMVLFIVAVAIVYPSVVTLLLLSILSSVLSGYYIRQKFAMNLFIAGIVESVVFFGGLAMFNVENYFYIMAMTLTVKILTLFYGKTFFSL